MKRKPQYDVEESSSPVFLECGTYVVHQNGTRRRVDLGESTVNSHEIPLEKVKEILKIRGKSQDYKFVKHLLNINYSLSDVVGSSFEIPNVDVDKIVEEARKMSKELMRRRK